MRVMQTRGCMTLPSPGLWCSGGASAGRAPSVGSVTAVGPVGRGETMSGGETLADEQSNAGPDDAPGGGGTTCVRATCHGPSCVPGPCHGPPWVCAVLPAVSDSGSELGDVGDDSETAEGSRTDLSQTGSIDSQSDPSGPSEVRSESRTDPYNSNRTTIL
mmetsp:Transcript_104609/g.207735  ORF Transcript_104609/g.207735 Transcript_104609/m.207735 type:complete len:160 (+) Transcript_104609:54-533(+)